MVFFQSTPKPPQNPKKKLTQKPVKTKYKINKVSLVIENVFFFDKNFKQNPFA